MTFGQELLLALEESLKRGHRSDDVTYAQHELLSSEKNGFTAILSLFEQVASAATLGYTKHMPAAHSKARQFWTLQATIQQTCQASSQLVRWPQEVDTVFASCRVALESFVIFCEVAEAQVLQVRRQVRLCVASFLPWSEIVAYSLLCWPKQHELRNRFHSKRQH